MKKKAVAMMYWLPIFKEHVNTLLLQTKREVILRYHEDKHRTYYLLGIPVLAVVEADATREEIKAACSREYYKHISQFHPDLADATPRPEENTKVFIDVEERDEWITAAYATYPLKDSVFCLFPELVSSEEITDEMVQKIRARKKSGPPFIDLHGYRIVAHCSVRIAKKIIADPRLKEAEYPCWGVGFSGMPPHNKVAYIRMNDWVVFSGIELERRTSTINAAESIIEAIVEQEKIDIMSHRWFDLQTHRGYHSIYPGKFQFKELELTINPRGERAPESTQTELEGEKFIIIDSAGERDFSVARWNEISCPENIHDLFQECIG